MQLSSGIPCTTGMLLHKPLLSREHRSGRNMVAAYHRQNKDHSACLDDSWTSPLLELAINLHIVCYV